MDTEYITWEDEARIWPKPIRQQDILRVCWRLLDSCTYECAYCPAPRQSDHFVALRDRMLSMAWKILACPSPAYHITLTGGEATLHPALPDLLHYFLTSRRTVAVTLVTNGSRDISCYSALFQGVAPGRLRLALYIHPESASLDQTLHLLALAAQNGLLPHARLVTAGNDPAMGQKFYRALAGLRRITPFQLEIIAPKPGVPNQASWEAAAMSQFSAIASQGAPLPATWFGHLQFDASPCARTLTKGQDHIRINPDGSYYNAKGSPDFACLPLWRASGIGDALEDLSCQGIAAASTSSGAESEKTVSGRTRLARLQWFMEPLRNPAGFEPELSDVVRFNLQKLGFVPENASWVRNPGETDGLGERFADVCAVYAALDGDESRRNFLRHVILNATGGSLNATEDYELFQPGQRVLCAGVPEKFLRKAERKTGKNGFALDIGAWLEHESAADIMQRLRAAAISCSLVWLGYPPGPQMLPGLQAIIYNFQPDVQIRLADAALIDVPLWLIKKFPDYSLRFGKNAMLSAVPPQCGVKKHLVPADASPAVSVIIYASTDGMGLLRSINSVLAQTMRDFEIILMHSGGSCLEAARTHISPMRANIRYCHAPSQLSTGAVFNMGLDRAAGKYVVFLRAGEYLLPHALSDAREICSGQNACEIAVMSKGESGTADERINGKHALEKLLEGVAGPFGASGRLYSRQLLLRSKARFADRSNYSGVPFLLRAFYQATDIGFTSANGYAPGPESDSKGPLFADFAGALADLDEFFAMNGLGDAWKECACVTRLFERDKQFLAAEVLKASSNGDMGNALPTGALLDFGKVYPLVDTAIREYARNYFAMNGLIPPLVRKVDNDGCRQADAPVLISPMGSINSTPLLSVILNSRNSGAALKNTLGSILRQSFKNFELIIVDEASTDGSMELLETYAALYPQIRLYAATHVADSNYWRKWALREALGSRILFVEGGDICLPDYFRRALDAMASADADLVLVSSERVLENGVKKNILPDTAYSTLGALREYFSGTFDDGAWAKIYRKSTLERLEELSLFGALEKSRKVISRAFTGYCHVSGAMGDRYLAGVDASHAACAISLICGDQQALNRWNENRIVLGDDPRLRLRQHLQNELLAVWAAFAREDRPVPVKKDDCERIGGSADFILELLTGFARCLPAAQDNDAQPSSTSQPVFSCPLISVVVARDPATPLDSCLKALSDQTLPASAMGIFPAAGRRCPEQKDSGFLRDVLEQCGTPYVVVADSQAQPLADAFLEGVAFMQCFPGLDAVVWGTGCAHAPHPMSGMELARQWAETPFCHMAMFRREYIAKTLRGQPEEVEKLGLDFLYANAASVLPLSVGKERQPVISVVGMTAALDKSLECLSAIETLKKKTACQCLPHIARLALCRSREAIGHLKSAGENLRHILTSARLGRIAGHPELMAQLVAGWQSAKPEPSHFGSQNSEHHVFMLAVNVQDGEVPDISVIIHLDQSPEIAWLESYPKAVGRYVQYIFIAPTPLELDIHEALIRLADREGGIFEEIFPQASFGEGFLSLVKGKLVTYGRLASWPDRTLLEVMAWLEDSRRDAACICALGMSEKQRPTDVTDWQLYPHEDWASLFLAWGCMEDAGLWLFDRSFLQKSPDAGLSLLCQPAAAVFKALCGCEAILAPKNMKDAVMDRLANGQAVEKLPGVLSQLTPEELEILFAQLKKAMSGGKNPVYHKLIMGLISA